MRTSILSLIPTVGVLLGLAIPRVKYGVMVGLVMIILLGGLGLLMMRDVQRESHLWGFLIVPVLAAFGVCIIGGTLARPFLIWAFNIVYDHW